MQQDKLEPARSPRGIILVVGIGSEEVQALAVQLRQQNFRILLATGPTTALFMLGSLNPDLAIITAEFGVNPLEMVRAMRVVEATIPLIVDVAKQSENVRAELRCADSLRLWHEPLDFVALMHALDELMPSKTSGTRRLF